MFHRLIKHYMPTIDENVKKYILSCNGQWEKQIRATPQNKITNISYVSF